ncbi:MAG TPA: hypothetical protein VFE16_00290 [Candidatus Cybelea sp.]|jgi:hypothetical protein|nr:hypothetical protein [Candidatus Cybelea sp.]
MLYVRGVLAVVMIALGLVILARMLVVASAGFAIVPGLVLGAAMIALGFHRLSLILRNRRMT